MNKVADLFFCQAWAITESLLKPITEVLHRHVAGEKLSQDEIDTRIAAGKKRDDDMMQMRKVGSRAIIPIYGIISKRASLLHEISPGSGTSTMKVAEMFRGALKDPEVSEIVLDIDSPGGSVSGVAELSDLIFEARGKKPITAYASGMMASAAYWIGSAADKVYATKATQVGSIGVYSVVYDATVAAHNEGYKVEVIQAGKHKATGHPYKTLSSDDRKILQQEVDSYFELFTDAVGKHRNFNEEKLGAVATGQIWLGADALENGLIDGIKELVEAEGSDSGPEVSATADMTVETADADNTTKTEEVSEMDLSKLTLEQLLAGAPVVVEQLREKLTAELKAQLTAANGQAVESAKKEAADAERSRAAAIVAKGNLPEYAGCGSIVQDSIMSGLSVADSEGKMKDLRLKHLNASAAVATGATAPEIQDVSTMSLEDRCKVEWEKDPTVKRDFDSLQQYTLWAKRQEARAEKE